jgi:hypothetical protein
MDCSSGGVTWTTVEQLNATSITLLALTYPCADAQCGTAPTRLLPSLRLVTHMNLIPELEWSIVVLHIRDLLFAYILALSALTFFTLRLMTPAKEIIDTHGVQTALRCLPGSERQCY